MSGILLWGGGVEGKDSIIFLFPSCKRSLQLNETKIVKRFDLLNQFEINRERKYKFNMNNNKTKLTITKEWQLLIIILMGLLFRNIQK